MINGVESENKRIIAERENEIRGFSLESGDVWTFLDSTNSDIDQALEREDALSRPILSDETMELMEVAGWNSRPLERAVLSALVVKSEGRLVRQRKYTSLRHHIENIRRFESGEELEKTVADALRNNPEQYNYFAFIFQKNPMLGASVSTFYEQAKQRLKSQDGGTEHPYESWFVEAIDNISETARLSSHFFSQIWERINEEDEISKEFIKDWAHEVLLPLVEATSLVTCSALHTKVEDCAVLMTSVPLDIHRMDRAKARKDLMRLWEPDVLPDGRTSTYNENRAELKDFNEQNPENPHLPIYSNVTDAVSYVKFLRRYWQQIVDGMDSKKGIALQREFNDGGVLIHLGNAAKVFIRPQGSAFGQARIYLEGIGSLSGFNIRVDRDENHKKLSVDFGSLKPEQAIAYADEVKEKDAEIEAITKYSKLVNPSTGELKRVGSDVVSIMRSSAKIQGKDGSETVLTDGNKAALIAAVAMREGQAIGIRSDQFFLYHSREFINRNEYFDNFPRIASAIRQALVRI